MRKAEASRKGLIFRQVPYMVFDIFNLVESIWIILPAFAANGLVPLIKGKYPMDFNKKVGKMPLLGKGKTWEGLIFGSIIGMFIASTMQFFYPYLPWSMSPLPLEITVMTPLVGLLLGFGAIFGDAVGSFFKRRTGLARGQPAPVLDQIDFLLGAFIIVSFVVPLKASWLILLLIVTPIFHLSANYIAFLMGVKNEPY